MDAYLNLWGGEGYLTCASVHAMAMVGMFEDMQDVTLKYKCLDFADNSDDDIRWKSLANAFKKYHNALFGEKSIPVVCDSMNGNNFDSAIQKVVNNPAGGMTLDSKFNGKKEILAIGISENDIQLDIKEGIYGKPWVGEAYHADSHFDSLYPNTFTGDDQVIVMNCGGYKGGGTAATFIPLESLYQITGNPQVSRFNIVAGPSTQFNRQVKIEYPDAYNGQRITEWDRFDIDNAIEYFERQVKPDDVSKKQHQTNIDNLRRAKAEVSSTNKDYSSLNPNFYMARFIDKIRADESISKVNATFVNIKSNLRQMGNSYNYDQTAKEFKPDKQDHQIHITNLLNAVTVKEIMRNHANYTGSKIYTFASPSNTYEVKEVFEAEDVKKFYYFLELVIFMAEYVYPYFNDIKLAGSEQLLKQWALKEGRKYATEASASKEGNYNETFAKAVKEEIRDFLVKYALKVLDVFWDVNEVSEGVNFFPKDTIGDYAQGIYDVVNTLRNDIGLISKQNFNRTAETVLSTTSRMLAVVSTVSKGLNIVDYKRELDTILGTGFFASSIVTDFNKNFPTLGHKNYSEVLFNNINEDAKKYSSNILNYCLGFTKSNTKLKIQ